MNPKKEVEKLINRLFTTSLGRGSLIMVSGSFFIGAISFVFNPIMGILLGPAGYGELTALLSLLVVFSVPSLTLSTVLIKFAARYQAQNDQSKSAGLFYDLTRKLVLISLLVIGVFWLSRTQIANFLQVSETELITLLGVLTMATVFFTVNTAFLQGLLKFEAFTLSSFLNAFSKVVLAALLVWWGTGVWGALTGLILAVVIAYFFSFIVLGRYFPKPKDHKVDWSEILLFVLPAFLSMLGITLLNNLDIILVKHFFSPVEAGYYSAAVVTSRLVIFAVLPITQIIFPLVVQRFESKQKYHHLVMYALALTVGIGLGVSTLYYLFPEMILKFFFLGKSGDYLPAQNLLGIFGLFVTLYSVNTLFTYLFLSLHKVRFAFAPLLAGVLQGTVIWFYHPTLTQVVTTAIAVNLVLCLLLLGYYWRDRNKFKV